MDVRKDSLANDQVYHVFTKSIAEYMVFNKHNDFLRMIESFLYYQKEKPLSSFSKFIEREKDKQTCSIQQDEFKERDKIVDIIAYCVMPTHLHLVLKQLKTNGISVFMSNVLNSYSRYFNVKHNRKGPLWEGRFKSILVDNDEYLIHLTRYIHLNPTTAGLVSNPEDWSSSSYNEYLKRQSNKMCSFEDLIDINTVSYKVFVEDRISYQRDLAKIKKYIME